MVIKCTAGMGMRVVKLLHAIISLRVTGAGVVGGGVASSTDVHHRHIGDNRRIQHSRLE